MKSTISFDADVDLTFGQVGDGAVTRSVESKLREVMSTADHETFAETVAAAEDAGLPVLVNANRTLTANLSTAARLIPDGGIITTGSHTLTVGGIDGPEIPLFDKAGTGAITLSDGGPSLLGWFSPTADGATVDTNPVTRWVNSSLNRKTGLIGTIVTGTVPVPTALAQRSFLECAGRCATYFKSLTGADIFTFPGVIISRLYYVSLATVGGFTGVGQGRTTGAGYVVHIPSTVSTGRGNRFYDLDCDAIGGGTAWDDSSIGLFSTDWDDLNGGNCGNHVFYMKGGGPASVMRNCYPRNAKAGKAGFRVINQNLELQSCNGLDVDTEALSFWGTFGACTSATTINATTGGSITIPADSVDVAANPLLRHCNVEFILDVGILALNGTVRMDDSCILQSAPGYSNCIAVYCTDTIGAGTQGSLAPVGNFVLTPSSTWAHSCPIWVQNATAIFAPPRAYQSNYYLPIWEYTDGIQLRLSAIGSLYVGASRKGSDMAAKVESISADILALTPYTPASSSATGRAGEIAIDTGYVYVCTAANTWKRAALSTW